MQNIIIFGKVTREGRKAHIDSSSGWAMTSSTCFAVPSMA